MTSPFSDRLDRRTALKWMGTAAASSLLRPTSWASEAVPAAAEPGVTIAEAFAGAGYGTDPDLLKNYEPGELWPLSFNEQQRRTAAVLCGLIIPADDNSPSAADLKVHDFIDEWISAPYPQQVGDRQVILAGLAQLDLAAESRFGEKFADLRAGQHEAMCDELATVKPTESEELTEAEKTLRMQQNFFRVFRNLTAGGFYTTPEGMKDVGYLGNVVLAEQPKPPADLLIKLGLD